MEIEEAPVTPTRPRRDDDHPDPTGACRYPSISTYGLLANGRLAALVSMQGSIDWACLRRLDAGSVFGRLLDWDHGGHCSVTPTAEDLHVQRHYRGPSLVLETTFHTATGSVRLIDCIPAERGGDDEDDERLDVVRLVHVDGAPAEIAVVIDPRFDYGDLTPWVRQHGIGLFTAVGGDDGLQMSTDLDLSTEPHRGLSGRCIVEPGADHWITITYRAPHLLDDPKHWATGNDAQAAVERTEAEWRDWAGRAEQTLADQPEVLRSAIVLRGLTNPDTGGIAAAATTSLPEDPGGVRNWDYRLSWVRDSWLTSRSMGELGFEAEAEQFRRFVERSAACNADRLQLVYGLGGERRIDETTLDHLEGWRGSRPVRIGNGACKQTQLDVYGSLLQLSWEWVQRSHEIDDDFWEFLAELADRAADGIHERDQGMWEGRGDGKHFVYSKVMCWVAVDRAIRLAERTGRDGPIDRWRHAAVALRDEILERAWNDDLGSFVATFDGDTIDAAALLLPVVGFLPVDDPRMRNTVDVIIDRLGDDGLIHRYNSDDGLPGSDPPFIVCTFWLAECLAAQGRIAEAEEWFGRAAATANDLGLFSEAAEASTGEPLGNFPQALSHLGHLSAAIALRQR